MQIMAVLKAFLEYAKKFAGKRGSTVIKVNAFLQGCMIDNVNLFKLARYFEKSEISKKVNGFVLKQEETRPTVASRGRGGAADYVSKHVSALKMTESFFHSLTNADKDGRLVIQSGPSLAAVSIKFLLLNPAVYFDEVLSKVGQFTH
jgi:chromosome transmission fidelity protein 1